MTIIVVTPEEIDDYIKIFLSCCHIYYSVFYGSNESDSKKNPFWNNPNFLSLLNLPKQIHQFGSLRLHWEGIHERYIQNIKPYLKNMRTATSFLITKLDHIHKNNILKNQLIDDLYVKKNYARFQDNKKYKLVSDIEQMITVGSTLIGFLY